MATVMRSNEGTGRPAARVIRAVGGDANAERATHEAMVREAANLVADARAEADAIRRQAYEEGLAAGRAAADERREASGAAATRELATLVGRLEELRTEWLRRWESNVVRLATAMASRIVRRAVRQTPEIPFELARESLELAAGCARVRVALHPDDARVWEPQLRQLAQRSGLVAQFEVQADEGLERGECRTTTDQGEIDQRFDVQLARIAEELT